MNDDKPPSFVKGLLKSSVKEYTRLNTGTGMNSNIDHFYSNCEVKAGSMAITRSPDYITQAGEPLRRKLQSDHLALYTYIAMMPMKSTRLPMINKLNMISEFKNATRKRMSTYRKNFFKTFLKTRESKIKNDIGKIYEDKRLDKAQI